MFLIDTNVLSELTKRRPETIVLQWFQTTPLDRTFVSIVTLAELVWGAERTADETKRSELATWLDTSITPRYAGRTIEVTQIVLRHWFELMRKASRAGVPRSPRDSLIAASALASRLTVVTRNWRDFQYTGVTVFDPWTGKTHQMDKP